MTWEFASLQTENLHVEVKQTRSIEPILSEADSFISVGLDIAVGDLTLATFI